MSSRLVNPETTTVRIRVFLLGAFRAEYHHGDGTWSVIRNWGASYNARRLCAYLLLAPHRQASRHVIRRALWLGIESAPKYLNDASSELRRVFRESDPLVSSKDLADMRLSDQTRIWCDVDHGLTLLREAEAVGPTTPEGMALLQDAKKVFDQGDLLIAEEGIWCDGPREILQAKRTRCLFFLAEGFMKHQQYNDAEFLAEQLLREDPRDEEALRYLMQALHAQQRTNEALRCYRRAQERPTPLATETHQLARSLSHTENIPVPSSQLWSVPYLRNPFFSGRENLLNQLFDGFHADATHGSPFLFALCGLGGIGKTQIALEYAYRFHQHYQAIFWVKADTRENLIADFVAIACLLCLPEHAAENRLVALEAVKRWFLSHQGWLLILDNVDDLIQTRTFLPTGHQGHILLTMRAQSPGGLAQSIQIEPMDLESGTHFLLHRAGLSPSHPMSLDETTIDTLLARTFVQEVDGLPLALDQAGAYIEETATSLQRYLDLYRSSRLVFLQKRGALTTDHPESVVTTWTLAFTAIEQDGTLAASLLRLCAFLDPDAIPEELLFAGIQPTQSIKKIHHLQFHDALGSLLRFSLVRRNKSARAITIHRLVQCVVRDHLHLEQQREWIYRVVSLLSDAFPPAVEVEHWPLCEKLLPHALLCTHWIEHIPIISADAASLLNRVGYYLNMRARFDLAEPLLQRAFHMQEQLLGEQHPDTAQTLSDLAYLYHHQDQFEQAMYYLERARSIRQNVLGMDHPDTATTLNALALLYRDQCNYEEAESYFQQALALRKQIFGMHHPQTAHSLNNLAWFYRTLGRHDEAESLYEQSLSMRMQLLGNTHPMTASSLNGLALLYTAKKQYTKAEPLLRQVLTIRQQVIGATHLHTTQTMHALASLYQKQGAYEKAEELLLEVIATREQMLGARHPRTATSLYRLALLYRLQGKRELATPFLKRALIIREHHFGAQHPQTLVIFKQLKQDEPQGKRERDAFPHSLLQPFPASGETCSAHTKRRNE